MHNSVLERESPSGGSLDEIAARDAQLNAYKAAQWTGFGFAMLGE